MGVETISISVDNLDNDDDGDPDISDPDDDNDGLLDIEETGDGIYVSPSETGTNPFIADTDGDGYSDGDEVNEILGYLSDPNKPNYFFMAVPGSYTTPAWKEDGSAGNAMAQVGTDLSGQYQWTLDYNFRNLGNIEYKFAANGTWANNWGNNGNNINATIQASGFHTFSFDNTTLAYSLVRTAYADSAAFLAAYGLSAGADDDGDGVLNEDEFAALSDPTNDDTDGDGMPDGADNDPLVAGGYIAWANANAGGQPAGQDHDGDGVANGLEYFMGETGSSFTANPSPDSSRVVTWPRDPAAIGVTFAVFSSSDLSAWTDVTASADTSDPDFVKYTIPAGTGPVFVRLAVSNP